MPAPLLLRHEADALATGHSRVAGVDEAGRGPLAGPVVAGAVVFLWPDPSKISYPSEFEGLTDSKKLSETKRELFFERLHDSQIALYGVGIVDAGEIDSLNILRATHLAMKRALLDLPELPPFALVDGLPVKGLPCEHEAIVKGDANSLSISAASIVAKVTRDRIMKTLHKQFPAYGFAQHKGYGTKAHLSALREYGPSPAHRMSFKPVAQLELF